METSVHTTSPVLAPYPSQPCAVPSRHARRLRTLCALGLVLVVAACGGGGGGGGGPDASPQKTPAVYPAPAPSATLASALLSGDASALSQATPIAEQARYVLQQLSAEQSSRVSSLWQGVGSEYAPSNHSQYILPVNPELAQPFVVGDQGHVLASISVAEGGRSAGYGTQVLEQFRNNTLSHAGAFKRLVGWLVSGNAEADLPSPLSVAWAGVNASNGAAGMVKAGIPVNTVVCDFIANASCASAAQLLVVGGGVAAGSTLEASIRALVRAGKPVLYVHTNTWGQSDSASQMLAGMGLQLGDYGGNYWANDRVAAGRSAAVNQVKTDQFRAIAPLVNTLASENFVRNYDWSQCSGNSCSALTDLQDNLLTPVETLRSQIDAFNRAGSNLFDTPNTQLLRLLVLWGDTVRQQTHYPMDKLTDPVAFQKSVIADGLVSYVRPQAPAQADLGTFAAISGANLTVSSTDETVDVLIPATSGFTAVGRFAVPGKTFVIEFLDGGGASLALRLNTQRTGSTRLWETNKYNRPRFLASPAMALAPQTPLHISSPYGGMLQLAFSNASASQNVRLRLRGVAKHPFLGLSTGPGDKPAFVAALNAGQFDWAEIKLAGIEVHSRADKLRKVVNDDYGNDMDRYIHELQTLFFEDLYLLAGYAIPGKSLTAHVQSVCTAMGWDCTTPTLHRSPGTQHINVDAYAQCGSGCSGNPYDQDWGLNPRGWGESHEVGHNQQKGMLQVYSGRSTEVSNNLFPLHKNWRMLRELNDNRSNTRVAYLSTFAMLQAARLEADPIEGAYQRIWGSDAYAVQNGERMAFYMQWVHYWAQRMGSQTDGWDMVTLLYLHQRQFNGTDWATNKVRLGYSQYSARPDVSGNDNLLITLSWITQRDHRPTFDLWGVRYTPQAANQVASYGFAAEPALFYANTSTNDHATVRKVDMGVAKPVWPF